MNEPYELRCANKLYGIIVQPGILEVACRSRYCGWRAGKVILHRFEISTGKLLLTKEYKTVDLENRRDDDGTNGSSVRHA